MKSIIDYTNELKDFFAQKQALSDEVITRAKLGAHNICPFDIANIKANNTAGSWNGNTYTVSGLTFTVNNDGTVTISGNSLGTVYFSYYYNANGLTFMEDGEAYILSGAPSSLAAANGYLYLNKSPEIASKAGDEKEFTYASSVGRTQIIIIIASGADLTTPITFYPMIRLATDTDPTYQPYAMTNRELTDVAQQVQGNYITKIVRTSVKATADGTKSYKTLLNELATSFLNVVQALPSDEVIRIRGLYISGSGYWYPDGDAAVVDYVSSASAINTHFSRIEVLSNEFIWFGLSVSTVLNNCYFERFTSGTTTDTSSNAPANNVELHIYYEVLKKIS